MRVVIGLLILLCVASVSAQEFTFGEERYSYNTPRNGTTYGGLTGYQIAFLLGYFLVVFSIMQQGLSKWGGFKHRLAAGIALGLAIMATAPVARWVETRGFAVTFRGGPVGLEFLGLLLIGLGVFWLLYKIALKMTESEK